MNRQEIQDSARQAFGSNGLMPDAEVSWATLTEMGWFMMTVPEAQGGLGLGREALAAIHYELGRALVPGPAIGHMVAVTALADTQWTDLLERAMAGEVMTLLHDGMFFDADKASHYVALDDPEVNFDPIVSAIPRQTWDETRRLFDLDWADQGMSLGGKDLCDALRAQLLLSLAADSLGGADAVLEMTIDYLKTRKQFDRPIAMFQALKHRVADLKIALASAEALLWSRAADENATLAQMGALKAHACQTYRYIAEEAIQLHGGIGLTQEHPCHLFLKRAMLNCALGRDADHWEEVAGHAAMEAHA